MWADDDGQLFIGLLSGGTGTRDRVIVVAQNDLWNIVIVGRLVTIIIVN